MTDAVLYVLDSDLSSIAGLEWSGIVPSKKMTRSEKTNGLGVLI
jgi:hypothetical protein